MSFAEFLDQGWNDHPTSPAAVLDRFDQGLALAASGADLAALSRLTAHTAGEHLGDYDRATALLSRIRQHSAFDADTVDGRSVARNLAALALARGDQEAASRWELAARSGPPVPADSDAARLRAEAAAMLIGNDRLEAGAVLYDEALALLGPAPSREDPATRALAATSNNLAAGLEERAGRSPAATALMVRAATEARRLWELAGTWLHVERAEYRLARSLLAAGRPEEAAVHAREVLDLCRLNDAAAEERFFGWEALALSSPLEAPEALRQMEALLGQVPADWADSCRQALAAARATLPG